MNHSIITTPTKSTFSAPVVQSRLEHHHQLQQKTGSKQPVKPEAKQQHQRSKSRGKRHPTPQKENSTAIVTPNTPAITILSRPSSNKNSSSNSHRGDNFDVNDNDRTNLVDHSGAAALIEESTSSSSSLHSSKKNGTSGVSNNGGSPVRRGHQYSDSVGEMIHRDIPVFTILKRPKSATDFVKTHQPALSNSEEEEVDLYRQHRSPPFKSERLPPNQNSRNGERRRSDTQPPKFRRTQRRKDIKPTTGSVDADPLFGVSPPQPSPLQDSSDESDVNSIINTYIKRVPSPPSPPQSNNAANFPIPTEAKDIESSFNRPLSRDFKRHSDVFLPTQSVAIPNTMRRQSITAIELKSEISTFARPEEYASFPLNAATIESSSPSKVMASNSKLYAGPTFHNSPAPSDLPLPSFLHSRYIGKEGGDLPMVPEVVSVNGGNRSDDESMFVMEDDSESNSFSFDDHYVRQQQSLEILTLLAKNVLAAQQPAVAAHSPSTAYNVPERMATSHPLHVFPQTGANLTEISENLRNILKIQGQ